MSKRTKFLSGLRQAAEASSRGERLIFSVNNNKPLHHWKPRAPPLRAKSVKATSNQESEIFPKQGHDVLTRTKEWVVSTNSLNKRFIHDPSKSQQQKSKHAPPHRSVRTSNTVPGNSPREGTKPCAPAPVPSSAKKFPEALEASPGPDLDHDNLEDATCTHNGFSVTKSPHGIPLQPCKEITTISCSNGRCLVEPQVGETPKHGKVPVVGAKRRLVFNVEDTPTNRKERDEATTSQLHRKGQECHTHNKVLGENSTSGTTSPVLFLDVQEEERVFTISHLGESNRESTVVLQNLKEREINNDESVPATAATIPGAEVCEDVLGMLANIPEGVIIDVPVLDASDFVGGSPVASSAEQHSDAEIEDLPDKEPGSSGQKRRYTPPEKLTRKRVATPKRWIRNVAKEKLAKGEEHVSVKGALRRGRSMGEGCDVDTCHNSCQTKISITQRKSIFDKFWLIPCQKEKWDFIARHIEIKNSPENPKKKCAIKYYFRVEGTRIKVCKTMFLDTLDVCDSLVKTTVSKLKMGGYISPDKRKGHTRKDTPLLASIKDRIREHIKLIPRMPSHYSRHDSNKEYITEDYNDCGDLYEEYQLWMAEFYHEEKLGTLRQYRDVFNFEFNIGFFCSKKDICDECTTWQNTSEENKPAIEEKYRNHKNNHDIVTAMKNADTELSRKKENKSCLTVAHFDFEKILICPKGEVSIYYYKRKLGVSNFTIVDVGQYEDNCYVYDETMANKGSNEVASFLLHFIERKVQKGVTEIRFYCDNCGGQNKNRNVATLVLFAAAKFNIRVVIKYLVKGHTYNKADTVHSLIERKTKKLKLFTPNQWYEKIKASKRSKSHPMNVLEVDQEMIFNWHDLQSKLNLDKDTSGAKIPWQSLMQLEASGSAPHELKYRTSFEEELKTVSTKLIGRPVNLKTYVLQKAYTGRLPISKIKYNDLIFYCNKNLVPPKFHDFYKNLPSSDAAPDTREEEQNDPREGRARKRRKPMPKKKPQPKRKNQARKIVGEGDDSNNEEED